MMFVEVEEWKIVDDVDEVVGLEAVALKLSEHLPLNRMKAPRNFSHLRFYAKATLIAEL